MGQKKERKKGRHPERFLLVRKVSKKKKGEESANPGVSSCSVGGGEDGYGRKVESPRGGIQSPQDVSRSVSIAPSIVAVTLSPCPFHSKSFLRKGQGTGDQKKRYSEIEAVLYRLPRKILIPGISIQRGN